MGLGLRLRLSEVEEVSYLDYPESDFVEILLRQQDAACPWCTTQDAGHACRSGFQWSRSGPVNREGVFRN